MAELIFETEDGTVTVDLEDLPPEAFDQIATAEGTDAWSVYEFPDAHPDRLFRVTCAAAVFAGLDPPAPDVEVVDASGED